MLDAASLHGMAPPRLTSALLRLQIKLDDCKLCFKSKLRGCDSDAESPSQSGARLETTFEQGVHELRAQLESARQQSSRWKSSAELHRTQPQRTQWQSAQRRTRVGVRSTACGPVHPVDGSRPRNRARRTYLNGESSGT